PDDPPSRKGVARGRLKLLVFALVLLLGLGPVAVWLLQPTAGATTAIWQTVSSPIATESSLAVLPPAPVDAAPVDPSILDTGLTDTTYLQSDSTAKRARPAAPARRVTRRHPTVSHPIRRHAPAPAPTPARPVLRTTLTEPALLSVNSRP